MKATETWNTSSDKLISDAIQTLCVATSTTAETMLAASTIQSLPSSTSTSSETAESRLDALVSNSLKTLSSDLETVASGFADEGPALAAKHSLAVMVSTLQDIKTADETVFSNAECAADADKTALAEADVEVRKGAVIKVANSLKTLRN